MTISVTVTGDRELTLRFERFPVELRSRLAAAVRELTEELYGRVLDTEPFKTGKLRAETVERVFEDTPERLAGYVSIYAPGNADEYAKAATLEYGTDKPRKVPDRAHGFMTRLNGSHRRILARFSKPVHIEAHRFLRGPLAAMRGEVEARLNAAIAQAAGE